MTNDDVIAVQDQQRSVRQFISFLTSASGADQTLAGQDSIAVNQPNQYQTVTPFGVSTEGKPVSNQQGTVTLTLPMLLLIGAIAFLVMK